MAPTRMEGGSRMNSRGWQITGGPAARSCAAVFLTKGVGLIGLGDGKTDRRGWSMAKSDEEYSSGDKPMRFLWREAIVAMTCAAAIIWSVADIGYTADRPATTVNQPPAFPDAVLKQTKPTFDGKSLDGWLQIPADSWNIKDGAMASTGAGRGVIYTKDDFTKYRLFFTMRHVSGQPDHQACVLIFCTRPEEGKKSLDALGAIQFQPPN